MALPAPNPVKANYNTGKRGRQKVAMAAQPARRRIGARFDQFGRVINYDANGNVAPAGTTGVGAVRPSQARDAVNPTGGSTTAAWAERFPNLPNGQPRQQTNAFARPDAVMPGVQAALGPAESVTRATARAGTNAVNAAKAFVPPNQTNDGDTYEMGANGLASVSYDPRQDNTRKATTTTDIADPTRTTKTLAIDPRYGGGTATATTNGGARPEMADAYADAAEAGTERALNAFAPPAPVQAPTPTPTPQAPAQTQPPVRVPAPGSAGAGVTAAPIVDQSPTFLQAVGAGARALPATIAQGYDDNNAAGAQVVDEIASGFKGVPTQAQTAASLDAQIAAKPVLSNASTPIFQGRQMQGPPMPAAFTPPAPVAAPAPAAAPAPQRYSAPSLFDRSGGVKPAAPAAPAPGASADPVVRNAVQGAVNTAGKVAQAFVAPMIAKPQPNAPGSPFGPPDENPMAPKKRKVFGATIGG